MISIVMPCYNCETSLARTVWCVQAQTVSDWELIAVDDGSTDGTGAALDGLAQNDARIRAIHQANGGVSRARNIGMAAARGEWLAFVDADDVLPPDALQTLLAPGRRRGGYPLRRIYHSAYGRGWTRRSVGLCPDGDRQTVLESLVRTDSTLNSMCAKLYRASKIREKGLCVPPGVKVGEDVLFNLDAFYAAHAWRMTERSVYGYDLGGDSAMTRADAHVYESAKPMLQGITAFIRKNGLQTALFRAHIDIYLRTLRKDRGRRKAAFAFNREIVSRVTEGVQFSALCARQRAYYAALKVCPCLSYFLP